MSIANVRSEWVDGNLLFYDVNGNVIFRLDGAAATVNGAIPAVEGLTVEEYGAPGGLHQTVLHFDGVVLETLDNGTAGHGGGLKIYEFPLGVINVLGASQNWELLTADGTGLPNDAEIDLGIGSTIASSAMASLTGTAQDIVNKDDITFSSSLSALDQFIHTVSGANALDGSATAADAFLNLAATIATADDDGTLVLTGTVIVSWINLGAKST